MRASKEFRAPNFVEDGSSRNFGAPNFVEDGSSPNALVLHPFGS